MARVLPLLLALPLLALPGRAAALLFELEALDVSGNLEFHDDFEDGDRFAPPTALLIPHVGTTLGLIFGSIETESGGALRITFDDEAPILPISFDHGWLSSFVPETDFGTTTVTWTVRDPGVPGTLRDRLFMSIQRVQQLVPLPVFIPTGPGAGFVLGWNPEGLLSISFLVPDLFQSSIVTAGVRDLVEPGSVGETLLFEIVLDHEAGTMRHRYSIDGGASWRTPAFGPVEVPPGEYGVDLEATIVPEPAASVLLLGGVLASRRACRTGARARPRRGRRRWRA